MIKKIRVGVLFGGRSGEHEVSLASASSILQSLDPERYEAVPIGITREGHWLTADSAQQLLQGEVTPSLPGTREAIPDVSHHGIVALNGSSGSYNTAVDVVFPVLHGTFGEDGTVQGVLEVARIPYVGSGVLAASLSMDKIAMKAALSHAGLPSVPYISFTRREWQRDPDRVLTAIEESLEYPVFPKPANSGSSVGISKAKDQASLVEALELAVQYDRRILVEQGVDAREVECSVLGNEEPIVSVPGEVIAHREFYDYPAKYADGLADLVIPAKLSPEQTKTVQDYARRAFLAVDAAGLARVDFFIRNSDGEVLVNEINTMPGFTATSMYPKLWEASGLPYAALVARLIELAFERFSEQEKRSFHR